MKKSILFIQLFLPLFVFSQHLVSISPSSASNGQTLNVSITGSNTHFTQGSGTTSVDFSFNQGSPTVVNSTIILNDTAINANITVPPNTYTGDYNVFVNNSIDGQQSLYHGFHVNGIPPPSLVSINPSSANNGQTLNVTITGTNTHFSQSATSVSFSFNQGSPTTIVNSTTILNDSSIDANITVPAFTYTGDYNVFVNNSIDGYLWLYNAFHVNGIAHPSLVSISPSSASNGQTLNVTITGAITHFTQGSGTTVDFSFNHGGSTVVNSTTILNDSSIDANITVPANTVTGDYNIFVNNSIDGQQSLYHGFHVNGIPPPFLVSISPAGVKPGQTLNVTITGANTHFTQGNGTYVGFIFNQGSATINSATILNDTSIIANITIPQNTNSGTYNAFVYNDIDGYAYKVFYVFDSCFSYYTTAYDYTNNAFTLTLDSITSTLGVSFNWDFGDGSTSTNQTPTHTFLLDTVYNVCLIITTNTGVSCSYCHVIGKDYAGHIFRQTGFSMTVLNYDGTIGISENSKNDTAPLIIAYPNPANDLITITENPVAMHNPVLSIYSIEGQLLLQQFSTQGKTELDISGLARGIYLIKMTCTENAEVIKFVKQ